MRTKLRTHRGNPVQSYACSTNESINYVLLYTYCADESVDFRKIYEFTTPVSQTPQIGFFFIKKKHYEILF